MLELSRDLRGAKHPQTLAHEDLADLQRQAEAQAALASGDLQRARKLMGEVLVRQEKTGAQPAAYLNNHKAELRDGIARAYTPDLIVHPEADWSYLDGGQEAGEGWMEPGFSASSWASGQGPFGFGDQREKTP